MGQLAKAIRKGNLIARTAEDVTQHMACEFTKKIETKSFLGKKRIKTRKHPLTFIEMSGEIFEEINRADEAKIPEKMLEYIGSDNSKVIENNKNTKDIKIVITNSDNEKINETPELIYFDKKDSGIKVDFKEETGIIKLGKQKVTTEVRIIFKETEKYKRFDETKEVENFENGTWIIELEKQDKTTTTTNNNTSNNSTNNNTNNDKKPFLSDIPKKIVYTGVAAIGAVVIIATIVFSGVLDGIGKEKKKILKQ